MTEPISTLARDGVLLPVPPAIVAEVERGWAEIDFKLDQLVVALMELGGLN